MSGVDRPREGGAMLSVTLLSLTIVLAVLAVVVSMPPVSDSLRPVASAFAMAALVHLCAAFAIGWTRRSR